MAEAVRGSTEAPLITGEGTYSTEYTALCAGYPDADSLRHACIAILGPQSSGKSTLLNDLFGTRFETLNVATDGQQQTTRGITAGVIPSTESSPPTLLLDCEGSESGERAVVADQNIERHIGAFASVTADILIVNILQTDVDRAEGSCSNFLQSIFRVHFQLSNGQNGYRKLRLFIAVRRCNGEGEDRMRMALFYKVRKMYEESVPDEFRERFGNFIDLNFWFIRDRRHENDEYMRQIREIRTQLLRLAAEAVQQPASSGRLPLTLVESPDAYEIIWGRLCSNGNLDFLSMQKAMGTEIAERCIEKFDAGLASLDLPVPASPQEILAVKLDPMRFVQSCADVASGAALSFDEQTEGYLDRPRAQQREILHRHIKSALRDKAGRVTRSISNTAVGIMSSASQEIEKLVADWDGEAPLTGPDDAAVALAGAVEELDAVYAAHRDGPLIRVQGLFHDPGFFHNRFVEEIDIPQQPSNEGVYGSLSALHASLLSWCVKLSAPLEVFCGVRETVAEARNTLGSLLIETRQAMQEAVECAGIAHLQCTGARVRSALSDTSADPQGVLVALYNDLINESQARVRRAAEALGWKDFPADGVLPSAREALLVLVQQEVEQFLRRDAVGVLAQAMNAAFVHDGAELRNYESEGSPAARYSEVREGLEAYVRSLGTVRLEGGKISVPGEQIDEVLRRANDEWRKMHSSIMERLRARQEIKQAREEAAWAKEELDKYKEQIKVLEESVRQLEAEMDRQREEAAQQVKKLDEALKGANNEIASLEKELATKSARVDALEQQLADTVKNSEKLNRLTPITDSSWTPLMRAVASGDIELVKSHLSDKDKRNSDGDTALMIAARMEHEDIVEFLDPTDKNGVTALMRAAERGDVETVKALIPLHKGKTARYIKINGRKIYEGTALMIAAGQGYTEVVRLLIDYESGQKDKKGQTALILGAWNGQGEVVRLLMVHEGDVSGWTNLMYAAYLGDTDAVRDNLHKKGYKDVTGMTGLMWAARQGHIRTVKVLLEHEKGVKDKQGHNALYHALKNGHTAAAEIIIPHEDPTDENGVTALMRAAAGGNVEMVELLAPLQKGMKGKDGSTAFVHALKIKHEALSWTLLMCAAVTGDVETAEQHLSDKDKKNDGGDTALMIAARAGHDDIVELLDPTDQYGITALMRAAARGDINTIAALIPLQKRRQTTSGGKCNNYGIYEYYGSDFARDFTALMFAALFNQVDAVRELAKYEAGMKNTGSQSNGATALSIAKRNNHKDIIAILSAYPEEHV